MALPGTPCVLIMEQDVLLKRALASLLSLGRDVEIVVSEAVNIEELIIDINKINPDAVLFSESVRFSQSDSLSRILKVSPMPKLIVVSEESNWLYVINREDKLLTDLSDLLVVIEST
jgi:hypothetical protein